jgi:broad specificity phosphatase PhoE
MENNNLNTEQKEGVKETTFYIVRHGETEAKANPTENGGPLVSGRLNTPLTEKGISEMKKVGEGYKNIKFDKVFISPLTRSEQSALAFLEGAEQMHIELVEDGAIIEINYGPHEGMPASEVDKIKKAFFGSEEGKQVDGLGYSFPGEHPEYGKQESFREGAERFSSALKRLAKENPGQNVLVISHSGIMRALQLTGKITNNGAEIGKDLKFGEVIKVTSNGENLELAQ